MVHFENFEEYQRFRREMGIEEEKPHSELVMEENTIYEIDTNCEKCLKNFWKRKAAEREGEQSVSQEVRYLGEESRLPRE